MRKSTRLPLTVKVRLGFNKVNVLETTRIIEEQGADAVAVHFRLKSEGYTGSAHWELAAAVKENLRIPLLGNGDIMTAAFALEKLQTVDGVLVGRGALANPFIFREIAGAATLGEGPGRLRASPGRPDRGALSGAQAPGQAQGLHPLPGAEPPRLALLEAAHLPEPGFQRSARLSRGDLPMPVKTDRLPVTVAFSGGKDSTAAILLLREQGHEVQALTMRLGLAGEDEKLSRIENLARVLAVPWEVCDVRRAFREKVLDPFIDAYRAGLTPNPCVLCNRHVKFGLLLAAAEKSTPRRSFRQRPLRRQGPPRRPLVPARAGRPPQVADLFPGHDRSAGAGKSPVPDRRASPSIRSGPRWPACRWRTWRRARTSVSCRRRAWSPTSRAASPEVSSPATSWTWRGTRSAAITGRPISPPASAAAPASLPTASGMSSAATWPPTPSPWATRRTCCPTRLAVGRPVFWRPLRPGETLAVKVRYQLHGHEAEIVRAVRDRIRAFFEKPVRAVTPGPARRFLRRRRHRRRRRDRCPVIRVNFLEIISSTPALSVTRGFGLTQLSDSFSLRPRSRPAIG